MKSSPDSNGNGRHNGTFGKGFQYLQQHYVEPIRVGDLVKVSGLSLRGLHKAFQKQTGRSPGRELRRLRLERAKELLTNSDSDLNTIALMCGYRSENSFWVSFKKSIGEAPGKYRSRRSRPVG